MAEKTLLIIDDSDLSFRVALSFLSRKSIRIQSIQDSEGAVEKARVVKPDLILVDFSHSADGNEKVCRRLHQDPHTNGIPVVVAGAKHAFPSKEGSLAPNCKAFLLKPLRRDQFLSVIEEHLHIFPREQPRIATSLPCTVRHRGRDGAPDPENGRILSLSLTGAFVEMETRPDHLDEQLEVVFSLPKWNNKVKVISEVVWVGKQAKNGENGAGVRFLPLPAIEMELIRRHIERP